MLDTAALARILAFAVIYAGVEFRYINRSEADWADGKEVYREKFIFWVVRPYHLYLLLPMFIAVSYSPSLTAWAGNTFLMAVAEDMAYFAWRGKGVRSGEWTTRWFGEVKVRGLVLPLWWPVDALVAVAFFTAPF